MSNTPGLDFIQGRFGGASDNSPSSDSTPGLSFIRSRFGDNPIMGSSTVASNTAKYTKEVQDSQPSWLDNALHTAGDLISLPGNAIRGGMIEMGKANKTGDIRALADSDFWRAGGAGFAKGLTGQKHYSIAETFNPDQVKAHPMAATAMSAVGDALTDPLMYALPMASGAAGKAVHYGFKGLAGAHLANELVAHPIQGKDINWGNVGLNSIFFAPEMLKGIKATGILKTPLARDVLGKVSVDAALSHLPEGGNAAQALREYRGGVMSGQVENGNALKDLAAKLSNATPAERETLSFLRDAPKGQQAAEAIARAQAVSAEQVAKEAHLGYQKPAPWDAPTNPSSGLGLPTPKPNPLTELLSRPGAEGEPYMQQVARDLAEANPSAPIKNPRSRDLFHQATEMFDTGNGPPTTRAGQAAAGHTAQSYDAIKAVLRGDALEAVLPELSPIQRQTLEALSEHTNGAFEVTGDTIAWKFPHGEIPQNFPSSGGSVNAAQPTAPFTDYFAKIGVQRNSPFTPEQQFIKEGLQNTVSERANTTSGAAGRIQAAADAVHHNPNPFAGVPDHLQHLAPGVMEKYGDLLPQLRGITDESYKRMLKVFPDLGYVENYFPRVSRAGAENANPLKRLWASLAGESEQAVLTKPTQMSGKLTMEPGLVHERELDTLQGYNESMASRGRHAVLDPIDATKTHLDQVTRAEQSMNLKDKLLGMGENYAVKSKQVPPGFMDMAHIPGWDGVAVQTDIGKLIEQSLLPKQSGPLLNLLDRGLSATKNAVFYNPAVHGKNLAERAVTMGENPIVSSAAKQEVKEFGPTLKKLMEHGGATEFSPYGEKAAEQLYREGRLSSGTASLKDKAGKVSDTLRHGALWDYDKALRVDFAKNLEAKGMAWPDIAKEVNRVYGSPLDPTSFNRNVLSRAMFTPAWTMNNLSFNAMEAANPRAIAIQRLKEMANQAATGHSMADNPHGKEENIAIGKTSDGKTTFLNPALPDRDAREMMRSPLDFLWQRMNPLINTPAGMALGNSRPFDPNRGLDYNKPGAGGPLIGYGSNGVGPDVGLRTQSAVRNAAPLFGFPFGLLANEGGNIARSNNPLRDLSLKLGGAYASDVNEAQAKHYDMLDEKKRKIAEFKAQAKRAAK